MRPARDVEVLLAEIVVAIGVEGLDPTPTSDVRRAAEIGAVLDPIARTAGRRVTWATVNNRRVDAGVEAGPREWRVVCSIDAEGVHSAAAFERPDTFPGVVGGRAVIVNGPSSAGKSTVMGEVVARADTPWVMFDELVFGAVQVPFLIWQETAPTLRAGFVAGIAALAAAGNQVITTGGPSEHFVALRRAVPTLTVGLDCPLDVRIARQEARPDRWGGLTEGSDHIHDGWTYDARFDTSASTAPEIAIEILRRVTS